MSINELKKRTKELSCTNEISAELSGISLDTEQLGKRIGIATGKYKVPDDGFFYDTEITEMFELI